ncbi:MAG: hypothetical protein R3261_13890 [Alphaproteobacteria bacterium]|nr:hypothetical protein [Alphaproteobacteria bacterium]
MLDSVNGNSYDAVIGAVPHDEFDELSLASLLKDGGLVADIKGMWRNRPLPDNLRRWSL